MLLRSHFREDDYMAGWIFETDLLRPVKRRACRQDDVCVLRRSDERFKLIDFYVEERPSTFYIFGNCRCIFRGASEALIHDFQVVFP